MWEGECSEMNILTLAMLIVLVETIIGVFFSTGSERVWSHTVQIWSIWFPELLHFRSTRGARAHWNMEFNGRMTRWLIYGGTFMVVILTPILVVFRAFFSLDARWFVSPLVLFLPLTTFTMLVTNRRQIRSSLRASLAMQGTRLCPTCDYVLRGNTSGTCPECGEAVEVI